MLETVLISSIIQWIIILILSVMLFALTRQVGILHERVAPAGALQPTSGPKAGEITEKIKVTSLDGNEIEIGGVSDGQNIKFILFISPTCPVCKELVPTAIALIRSEAQRMELFFASDGENIQQHKSYVTDLGITDYPYFVSERLGLAYQVSKLPFAIIIDGDGVLRSKGLVNTREHMESLIEAMDTGIATVQEYVGLQS
ncbi:thiol-disulfide isomerase [Gammaproteobacteria bacterium]|nr:thiol-disulfide isomerase [Gammaproteobacteria bacterium]